MSAAIARTDENKQHGCLYACMWSLLLKSDFGLLSGT
jgi:hypothetical protein